jgi:hypothetical protein
MPIEINDSAPTEPARVKRHKPKRGLGSAITRKRRLQAEALEKEVHDRREKARQAARNEMARLEARSKEQAETGQARWESGLLRTVVGNQTAVLRSYGFKQSVQCDIDPYDRGVTAWTDFTRIYVAWPRLMFPNRYDRNAVLDTVAQIKGVMQHEMGHIRFTTPWTTVMAAGTMPKVYQEDKTKGALLQQCWNMLEDQRMECLVVESVPRIANYFGTMVANVILGGDRMQVPIEQTWVMLAGRTYLPLDVLKLSASTFDQFCAQNGINNGAREWERLVSLYKSATTEKQIMKATVDAYEFIQKVRAAMPPTMDDHSKQRSNNGQADPKNTGRKQGSILDMFNEDPQEGDDGDGQGQGGGDQYDPIQRPGGIPRGEAQKSDEDGEGKGGKGKSDKGSKGVGKGDGEPNLSPEQDLEKALSDMSEHFRTQMREDGDVQSMARDANIHADQEGLPEYDGQYAELSAEAQVRAMNVAVGIQQALNSFVTTSAPIWQTRKENGIIDALAYRTKNPGDRDFRRHLEDHGNTGLDVHVSMLCDVSGSMGGEPMQALSESLYATGMACQALGIHFDFTLWSSGSQYYRLWRDGQAKPWLFPSMGGTDPTKALDDLDTHEDDASKHLVIIFTDGAWSYNFPSLQRWAAEDRTFVLVRYGHYDGEVQKDMGADSHIGISNVRDLPAQLTNALIDTLGTTGW